MKTLRMMLVLVTISLLVSGCIKSSEFERTTQIGAISFELKISYDEIIAINDSYVKNELEKLGYNVTIAYDPEFAKVPNCTKSFDIRKGFSSQNFTQVLIQAYSENNVSKGYFGFGYLNPRLNNSKIDTKQEEMELKEYIKSKVKEIATICNITVNVDEIKWTISYET